MLDGGAGADTMAGGSGNDIYYRRQCRRRGDRSGGRRHATRSMPGSTTRWRRARRSRTCALTAQPALTLTGNELANYLIGNAGNDILDGGAGNDTLDGGAAPTR